MSELHPDAEPLAFLLGTWRGEGEGEYPTIEPFGYGEEIIFEHAGEPHVIYSARSWSPDGEPLHFERGFLRSLGDGKVDLVLAHPIGLAELAEGTVGGNVLELSSTAVARTAAGDPVTQLARRYEVRDGELSYELRMATESVGLTRHARGRLRGV